MSNQKRFLRSKRLRASLWYAADGKCQKCGCELPTDWHADHKDRWAETRRTNVHEMEALCPKCHYEKTAEENRNMRRAVQLDLFSTPQEPIKLRKHQELFLEVCKSIGAGEPIRKILMLVTPGGGKSLIPVIAAAQLIPSRGGGSFQGTIADKICWVVPRVNLQKQAEETFQSPYFQGGLDHDHEVIANKNEPNPTKGSSGYVATYQAIVANPDLHAQELQRHRYILVLDEFHHLEEDGCWHRALQALVDSAVLVILVTGTDERGDQKPIAFMPYKEISGRRTPDRSDSKHMRVIQYTRGEALREGAIVPLHFEWGDGEAEWVDEKGEKCSVDSLAEAGDYAGIALRTALETGYARQLLTKCVENWKSHKGTNARAKLLVLAPSIRTADQYLKWLDEDLGVKALKATSDLAKEAQAAIKKFKKNYQIGDVKTVDVLVTVAMAYEGLDVPAITHIACLTHIRSVPWLEQCWARAARIDREAGKLKGTGIVFLPDDELARKCVEDIIAEQEPIIREKERDKKNGSNGTNGGKNSADNNSSQNSTIPLNSNMTRSRASDLSSGETVNYAETAKIQLAMQAGGIVGISTIQMKRALDAYNQDGEPENPGNTTTTATKEILTPSEELKLIRDKIEKYARQYSRRNQLEAKQINSEIFKFFGKSRIAMTFEELRKVWAWLQENYPMSD